MRKKYSVVIPVLNNKEGLLRTLESVRRLNRKDVEIVIVDGDSVDGTKSILEQCNDPDVKWISRRDSGIYQALNRGIAMSSGSYIAIINAGDEYIAAGARELFDSINDEDVAYGNQIVAESYKLLCYYKLRKPGRIEDMRYGMTVFHEATVISRLIYEKYGLYDESLKVVGDLEYLLRINKEQLHYKYHDVNVLVFYSGGVSGGVERYTEGMQLIDRYKLPTRMDTYKKIVLHYIKAPLRIYYNSSRMQKRRIRESLRMINETVRSNKC